MHRRNADGTTTPIPAEEVAADQAKAPARSAAREQRRQRIQAALADVPADADLETVIGEINIIKEALRRLVR